MWVSETPNAFVSVEAASAVMVRLRGSVMVIAVLNQVLSLQIRTRQTPFIYAALVLIPSYLSAIKKTGVYPRFNLPSYRERHSPCEAYHTHDTNARAHLPATVMHCRSRPGKIGFSDDSGTEFEPCRRRPLRGCGFGLSGARRRHGSASAPGARPIAKWSCSTCIAASRQPKISTGDR